MDGLKEKIVGIANQSVEDCGKTISLVERVYAASEANLNSSIDSAFASYQVSIQSALLDLAEKLKAENDSAIAQAESIITEAKDDLKRRLEALGC